MHFPLSTGDLARLLHVTEPRLGEAVRRGRVSPPPEVIAGRRLWTRQQALQAAEALGRLTDDIRALIEDAGDSARPQAVRLGRRELAIRTTSKVAMEVRP